MSFSYVIVRVIYGTPVSNTQVTDFLLRNDKNLNQETGTKIQIFGTKLNTGGQVIDCRRNFCLPCFNIYSSLGINFETCSLFFACITVD